MANQYAVIYRTGGTANFKWVRVLDTYPSRDAARAKADELQRMGYPSSVFLADQLDSVGMPDTFTYPDMEVK